MSKCTSKIWYALVCGLTWLLCLTPVQAASIAGKVLAVKGQVTASAGEVRNLAKDAQVFVTDRVETGDNSYAVLEFIDGSKATIRPNSALLIEKYVYERGNSDGALLKLVKGGLRAVTGGIAKQRPESYLVQAGVATLGVRGTEFVIRMCEDDCAAEEKLYTEGLVAR